MIYMDHHATTPAHPEVIEAMRPYAAEEFGNPSSTHAWGRRAAVAVAEARQRIAAMIHADDPSEIVFTAGATESDNLALRGAWDAAGRRSGHMVTAAIEHEAVLETCRALERRGARVTVLPVDSKGLVSVHEVREALEPGTVLLSLMLANNEIGAIQPVAEVGALCRERGILLHTDAVQAAGRLPLDVKRLNVDLMSLTAHKMYGPKGVGALYVRKGVTLEPMLAGGGQEGGLRSGTLNVAGIVGFGAAAAACARERETAVPREAALRDRLWRALGDAVDDIELNGPAQERLPNNLNVAFWGVEAEAVLTSLRDVAALSAGSACASSGKKGSYVLRALGGDRAEERARCSLRFGLGRGNTEAEVDAVAEHVARAVARLRAMAPSAGRAADALS